MELARAGTYTHLKQTSATTEYLHLDPRVPLLPATQFPISTFTAALTQSRRKVRQHHERRLQLLHNLSILFRLIPHADPLRIFLKRFPTRRRRFPASML